MHDIDHKDGNVAEGTPPSSQISEGLVPWSVNDKKSRNIVFLIPILDVVNKDQDEAGGGDPYLIHHCCLLLDGIGGEISCTYLLRNASCFTFLNIGLTDLEDE